MMSQTDETTYWQAVLNRDGQWDGKFFYGVRSTGVFCRPSCPARRPCREQVCFFDSPATASGAGFRPCKRCKPDQAANLQVERVQRACRTIEAALEAPLSLASLSAKVGSSPHHLQRQFKQVMGITPRQYADALRLKQLKAQLQAGGTILNAQYEAGYGSSRGLYERGSAQLGMTPATYRRKGKGMQISFSIVDCPLGKLLIAATVKGICAVRLGDSEEELKDVLRREFPAAQLQEDAARLHTWAQTIVDFLKGQQPHLDLPLDVQATAFQWRVWEALRTIGYGETRTYTQIARAIGQPQAVRAVARACATNPVSLIIPCHRVVREGGALAGYRWGLERKQKLLAQEKG